MLERAISMAFSSTLSNLCNTGSLLGLYTPEPTIFLMSYLFKGMNEPKEEEEEL